jgi:DNA invertase Pin-like site-specific DNA recombinase
MSGSQPLDAATATGRLMLAVIVTVGQAERETMPERQREGIAKAQREGNTGVVRQRLGDWLRRSSLLRRLAYRRLKLP